MGNLVSSEKSYAWLFRPREFTALQIAILGYRLRQ